MLTIIEGPDRTGKTTLCTSQPVHTRSTYLHFEKPTRHPIDEYVGPLRDYVPGSGADIWCDRHYLGECIWPEFFGRPTEMDGAVRTWIELFLQSRGASAVLACEYAAPTDDEPIAGHELDVLRSFYMAVDDSILPWAMYRFSHPYFTEAALQDASLRERRVAYMHRWVGNRWVGHPKPSVLLVGEQVARNSHGWDLPFVPYKSTSGHFMLTDLGDFFMEHDVAIINALKPGRNETEALTFAWRILHRPRVVALGRVAANALKLNDVPHEQVPHPQYWRRFKRSEGVGSYRKLIEEAIQ